MYSITITNCEKRYICSSYKFNLASFTCPILYLQLLISTVLQRETYLWIVIHEALLHILLHFDVRFIFNHMVGVSQYPTSKICTHSSYIKPMVSNTQSCVLDLLVILLIELNLSITHRNVNYTIISSAWFLFYKSHFLLLYYNYNMCTCIACLSSISFK